MSQGLIQDCSSPAERPLRGSGWSFSCDVIRACDIQSSSQETSPERSVCLASYRTVKYVFLCAITIDVCTSLEVEVICTHRTRFGSPLKKAYSILASNDIGPTPSMHGNPACMRGVRFGG